MPHPAEDITADEQAEITRAIEAGEILSDNDLAEYVKASTIADVVGEVGDDVLLAKRLLAAERARGDEARSTLVDKLSKAILTDADSADAGDGADGEAAEDPYAIKRQTDNAWWCPVCDHSQTKLIDACAGCGARRDGDTVTP